MSTGTWGGSPWGGVAYGSPGPPPAGDAVETGAGSPVALLFLLRRRRRRGIGGVSTIRTAFASTGSRRGPDASQSTGVQR